MKWTAIAVRLETKLKLEEIRSVMGARSVSDAVEKLVEFYINGMNARIRDIMCREFADKATSLPEWIKLLHSRGLVFDHIGEATKYLVGNPDLMHVDLEKCK